MRTLVIAGMALSLGACNCGPVTTEDAGMVIDAGVDAGQKVDAGVDAGQKVDAGPARVMYRITSVTGTFAGDGTNDSGTRYDVLSSSTCNYTGGADAGLYVGNDGGTPMIQVSGTTTCPVVTATSTGPVATCMAGPGTANATLFQGTIEQAGWDDTSLVTFKIIAPPGLFPACNTATVVSAASQPWGIQGTATAAQFKALVPFTVKLKGPEDAGTKRLVAGTNVSNVSWDFTMTVDPKLP